MKESVSGRLSVILLLLLVPLVSGKQAQEEFDGPYPYGEGIGVSSQGGPHREDPQYTQSQAEYATTTEDTESHTDSPIGSSPGHYPDYSSYTDSIWHPSPALQYCSNVKTEPTGNIVSPNYPYGYDNNQHVTWLIRTDPGTKITLTLLEVSLECGFDYLNIYDEWNTEKPLIGRFCSLPEVPTITSTSSEVFITFTSDSSVTENGFYLDYTTINDYPTNEPVDYDPFYLVQSIRYHHSLTEPMGNISSPNYPGNYDNNLVVTWLIVTDPQTKIELTFQDVSTECGYDNVQIMDGPSSSDPVIGTLCTLPGVHSLTSTSNALFINFTSDSSVSGRGFLLTYLEIGQHFYILK
ncbi:deleted in malignant brain tumors 1 protein [Biomphalaria glabrata]|nr:deleted in malignant brain tumors 1 protein [Biomphalaria glabrata]